LIKNTKKIIEKFKNLVILIFKKVRVQKNKKKVFVLTFKKKLKNKKNKKNKKI
jgi:hypothetical protein